METQYNQSLAEICRKGYYMCNRCSRMSHVGDYHEDAPPRCPHCKKPTYMEWHPPVVEDKPHVPALMTVALAILLMLVCSTAIGMDRFEALSQVESGDNDHAIGASGEISRYQITPSVWMENWPAPGVLRKHIDPDGKKFIGDPTDEFNARMIVWLVMQKRVNHFMDRYHRPPTDAEWYLLWHRPGRIEHPTTRETDRAHRFANLCQKP